MRCEEARSQMHRCLDGELDAGEWKALEEHLRDCAPCRSQYEELGWLRETLSRRVRLSAAGENELWKRLQLEQGRDFHSQVLDWWGLLQGFWYDLESAVLWSKLAAIPVTLAFFAAILVHFPEMNFRQWPSPVVGILPVVSNLPEPVITSVPVHYRNQEIDHLMNAAWKIPFEDSLSLVAEITPEGHAEIGNVLEYPRSPDLLRAVDLALRRSHFETSIQGSLANCFVIYSFHKVDVYEEKRGL